MTKTAIRRNILRKDVISEEKDTFDGYFGNVMEHVDAKGNIERYTYRDNLLSVTESENEYEIVNEDTGVVTLGKKKVIDSTIYDDNENPVKERSSIGETVKSKYDGDNVTEEVTINLDNKKTSDVSYEYDDNDNEISSIDTISGEEEYTEYCDSDEDGELLGEIKSIEEKLKGVTISESEFTYAYNMDGTKVVTETSICDNIRRVTESTTDVMGRMLSETVSVYQGDDDIPSSQASTSYTYDEFGRETSVTVTRRAGDNVPITTVTERSYDNNGTILEETDENGISTSYTYDDVNRVIGRTVTKDNIQRTYLTEYSYEDIDIYAGGIERTVRSSYVTTERNASGREVSKTYVNGEGETVRSKISSNITDTLYDRSGNAITTCTYGELENPEEGILSLSIYDEYGNNVRTVVNPDITDDGRFVITDDSIVTSEEYDAEGNLTKSTDACGNSVGFKYNIQGELLEVVQPGNIRTTLKYEEALTGGNSRITVTNAEGYKSVTESNGRGLETSVKDYINSSVVGNEISYEYDADGNLITKTEKNRNSVHYVYDSKGRNTEVRYRNAANVDTLKTVNTYDSEDRIIRTEDLEKHGNTFIPYYTRSYTYDSFGKIASYKEWREGEGEPTTPTLTYIYDADDNLTEIDYDISDSSLDKVRYEYDSKGRLWKVKADCNLGTGKTVREYVYDSRDRVSMLKDYYDFGINYIEKAYTYDNLGRVISMIYTDSSDDEVKEEYEYTYNGNNHILSERVATNYAETEEGVEFSEDNTDNGAFGRDITREYTYDALGRLTVIEETDNTDENARPSVTSYTYDRVGNRTSETKDDTITEYSYNGLNQLESSMITLDNSDQMYVSYSYDNNGNLVNEYNYDTTDEKSYVYDEANRLKCLTVYEYDTATLTQENRYSSDGQRIEKKETIPRPGQDADDERITNYHYENTNVIYTDGEEEGIPSLKSVNIYGLSGNVISTSRKYGNTEDWYTYNKDIRESTSSMIGEDGNAVTCYLYDAFGNTSILKDEDFDNEICYTGQIYDRNTELYYYNARYYNPKDGRFITKDTYRGETSDPDTLHLYAYCANNPINYVDPSGHLVLEITLAGYEIYIYRLSLLHLLFQE